MMPPKPDRQHDALLADLDQSIEKALDSEAVDLAGALFRIQGSVKGWCEMETCGQCPLAPHKCISDIDEHVRAIIAKRQVQKVPAVNNTISEKLGQPQMPTKRKRKIKRIKSIPVEHYFTQLHEILVSNQSDFIGGKIDATAPGHKLNWRRVNEAFMHPLTHKKAETDTPSEDRPRR